jgi:hypothetical protein
MAKRQKPPLPHHEEEKRLQRRGKRFEEICDRLEDAIAKIRKQPQAKRKPKGS